MGLDVYNGDQRLGSKWFRAAGEGDLEVLRQHLDLCVDLDLNEKDPRGLTALMLAAANGHVEGVQLLAGRGADLDALDWRGWTAATHAAFHGRDRCLEMLAARGANLDTKDFLGTTAAMRAAIGGHERCLQVLADHGADLLAVDNLGMAAVMHAHRKGYARCTSLLEEKASLSARRRLRSESIRKACRSTSGKGVTGMRLATHWEDTTCCREVFRRRPCLTEAVR